MIEVRRHDVWYFSPDRPHTGPEQTRRPCVRNEHRHLVRLRRGEEQLGCVDIDVFAASSMISMEDSRRLLLNEKKRKKSINDANKMRRDERRKVRAKGRRHEDQVRTNSLHCALRYSTTRARCDSDVFVGFHHEGTMGRWGIARAK